MSFSVRDCRGDFEWAEPRPTGAVRASVRTLLDPRFHRMLADLVRFNREPASYSASDGRGPSARPLARARRGFSSAFVERLIVPQASAVWSADPRQMWSFPARFLAEFFDNHGILGLRGRPRWRSIRGGSARYVEALIARCASGCTSHAGTARRPRWRHGVVIALMTRASASRRS